MYVFNNHECADNDYVRAIGESQVTFDITLGERARAVGLVYDAKVELVHEALRAGGLTDRDISVLPIVVTNSDNPLSKGSHNQRYEDSGEVTRQIVLNTYNGESGISTRVVAHEAKHAAERIHLGDSAFTSEKARLFRKASAVLMSAAFGATYYLETKSGGYGFSIGSAVGTDVLLSFSLRMEAALRRSERAAVRAGKAVVDQNVLLVTRSDGEPVELSKHGGFLPIVKNLLNQLLIPRFEL